MYGLRTAKEVRDSLAREHVISEGIKTLLLQVNTLVELAISEGNSHFTIHVPAEDYKKDTPVGNGDITEFKCILESHGYNVQVSPAIDDNEKLLHCIYVYF